MNRYRKKPVVIEASQFDGSTVSAEKILNWAGSKVIYSSWENDRKVLRVNTLEGVMTAFEGDWIIKGVNGEFYPCKPDIFSKTYELAEPLARRF